MSLNLPGVFDALQTAEQVQILDTVDALRSCGVDGIVSLPQLVVCGDQSSGKSSVLEAITEIPFPRKDNLCTRFATELVLRRSKVARIQAQVIPDSDRSQAEQDTLKKKQLWLSDFSKLPNLIDQVIKLMGLDDGSRKRAFSRDILRIVIEGPDRPALTLVDLPGLIHSENKSQSAEDVQVVSKLVEQYISNPRTIILPIISAMNDAANQIILNRAKEHDPQGRRTLGIITKPDVLSPDSASEDAFIELAMNQNIVFEKGWHVLRGRAFLERKVSFFERNKTEQDFFSKGRWRELDRDTVGISALRARLSELLFTHVKQELPKLRDELETASAQNALLLQKLGEKRASLAEQRQFLTRISTSFRDLCKAAVDGHYDDAHFGEDVNLSSHKQAAVRRLRAVIQKRHIEYADVLRNAGHKYKAVDRSLGAPGTKPPASKTIELGGSRVQIVQHGVSRRELLDWAKGILNASRGSELVGSYNPKLIGALFHAQSENWQGLAEQHISNVAEACSDFCTDLLRTICPRDIVSGNLTMVIEDALNTRTKKARKELKNLLDDKGRAPQTFNHYYTLTVQKNRKRRLSDSKASAEKRQKGDNLKNFAVAFSAPSNLPIFGGPTLPSPPNGHVHDVMKDDPAGIDVTLDVPGEIMDMDEHSCIDALDSMNSYYKVNTAELVPSLYLLVRIIH